MSTSFKKSYFHFIAATLALISGPVSAQELIVNGTFTTSYEDGWTLSAPTGGTVENQDLQWAEVGSDPVVLGTIQDGIMVDLDDGAYGATLSQLLTLNAGEEYRFSIDTRTWDAYAGQAILRISLVDLDTGLDEFVPLEVIDTFSFMTYAHQFTAVGTNLELRITNVAPGTGADTYFDNVSLSVVPEPGSALLLVLAGLLGVFRRRARGCLRSW